MPETHPNKTTDHSLVTCSVCKTEIPRSEAYSPEGRDYALFFCGLKCFDAWRRQPDPSGRGTSGNSER